MYKPFHKLNKFQFTCPIFETDVQLSDCLELRDQLWRGNNVVASKRPGCSACMRASKCPALRIVDLSYKTTRIDPNLYFSMEPKHGSLRDEELNFIAPIIITKEAIRPFSAFITEAELELIEKANEKTKIGAKASFVKAKTNKVIFSKVEVKEPVKTSGKPDSSKGAIIATIDAADIINKAL